MALPNQNIQLPRTCPSKRCHRGSDCRIEGFDYIRDLIKGVIHWPDFADIFSTLLTDEVSVLHAGIRTSGYLDGKGS